MDEQTQRQAGGTTEILILGGGFGGVYTARELERRLKGRRDVSVTLISRENFFLFYPLLPEAAGGTIETHHIVSPLRQLLRHTRVQIGEVEAIDLDRKAVTVSHGLVRRRHDVTYDQLVLALGGVNHYFRIPGVADHTLPLRSVDDGLAIRSRVIRALELAEVEDDPAERQALLTFIVAGGGATGVETAAEINDLIRGSLSRYRTIEREDVRVALVDAAPRLLLEVPVDLAGHAVQQLQRRGIEVILNNPVAGADGEALLLKDGTRLPSHTIIWAAGVATNPLLRDLPCARDERGRVIVDEYLAVGGYPGVWALGDNARVPLPGDKTAPPTSQFAIREGKALAQNIAASLGNGERQPFRFTGLGSFVTLGRRSALAEMYGRRFTGLPAWVAARAVHLAWLPRMDKKARVGVDWALDLLLGRDITLLDRRQPNEQLRARYQPGETIIRAGDPGDYLYVILHGEVEVLPTNGDTPVARLGQGEYFGEMAIFNETTRTATVKAAAPTETLLVPRQDVQAWARNASELRDAFETTMRRRLTNAG
ncbi:MAG: FAD-dependent oxidoreductase [Thermomicrobiales bacterium]